MNPDRIRTRIHERARSHRPTKHPGKPRRSIEPDLYRPRTHRHQPSTTRTPRSLSRVQERRHPRGCQTRPISSLPARCERHHRRTHHQGRETQHRRIRARSDRPGPATAVQRRPLHCLPNRSTICRKLKNTFANSRCRTKKPCNGTAKATHFGPYNPIADPAHYRFTWERWPRTVKAMLNGVHGCCRPQAGRCRVQYMSTPTR